MTETNVDRIRTLLKGIETGDPAAVDVISPDQYIQHNPQTHEGRAGLAALFKRLSKTNPRVNIVRAFHDENYVFAHTEYDFTSRRIGFEVFRFQEGSAVEHWDNIQPRQGPNVSGHSMVDGPTEAVDHANTETNRELVRQFVETVLIPHRLDRLEDYIVPNITQHSPRIGDGSEQLRAALSAMSGERRCIDYSLLHRVLAQGNFVLAVSEGHYDDVHSAYYDLFRVSNRKIVEHWNTIEAVAPENEWKNDNGKF